MTKKAWMFPRRAARLGHADAEVLRLVEWAQLSNADVAARAQDRARRARTKLHRPRNRSRVRRLQSRGLHARDCV